MIVCVSWGSIIISPFCVWFYWFFWQGMSCPRCVHLPLLWKTALHFTGWLCFNSAVFFSTTIQFKTKQRSATWPIHASALIYTSKIKSAYGRVTCVLLLVWLTCPWIDDWITKNMLFTHYIMLVIKLNNILPFAWKWIYPETIMFCEISQCQ